MATLTAERFHADLYRFLEQVIETGQPVEVVLRGRRVRVVPAEPPTSRLDALEPRPGFIVGDADELVHPAFDVAARGRNQSPAARPRPAGRTTLARGAKRR